MKQCRLYRWENADNSSGFFDVYGPGSPITNIAFMDALITREFSWLLVVTAYFLDEEGNYYEERITTSKLGPLIVKDQFREIIALQQELQLEAQYSGDQVHYQDTCSALYPYTPDLEARLEDEAWVQQQAQKRANLVYAREQREQTPCPTPAT